MIGGGAGDPDDPALLAALSLSQRLGMLGSRPIDEVVQHAMAFVGAVGDVPSGRTLIDLGSGGGAPGLVVAWVRRDLDVVLVERRATRADHLRRLVHRLAIADHVQVAGVDAAQLRVAPPAAAVTARGFGSPQVVLETATPLLAPDGIIVVSDPPAASPHRWPDAMLRDLGLVRAAHEDPRVAVFRRWSGRAADVPRGT
jgi:16S rRNA (guanine527-N7)-methyltransferase